MELKNIRNFAIISHIDHGKSTLADRFLEITNTVSKREMKAQFLDNMELEREKGITIKMRPVRMIWKSNHSEITNKPQLLNFQNSKQFENLEIENSLKIENCKLKISNSEYILNLIDTPGHIDFSYEVSRALAATEGVILLVDATQGIQAQTLANIDIAKNLGLAIIPAVNKIDVKEARIKETKEDISKLLQIPESEILEISGKTGQGVEKLLQTAIEKIPVPKTDGISARLRALIFDFEYSEHKGIIAFVRVFDGVVKKDDDIFLVKSGIKLKAKEVGFFNPNFSPQDEIKAGEIGYIVTGLKEPSAVKVGDTVTRAIEPALPLQGYKEPRPVIWANFFPESQEDFEPLKKSLLKLSLSDSAFSFEEINSPAVGRGFRLGFLGMLHMEILRERIKREFKIDTINTLPSVMYKIIYKDRDGVQKDVSSIASQKGEAREENIYSAASFPEDFKVSEVKEIWVNAEIFTPEIYLSEILKLLPEFEAEARGVSNLSGSRLIIKTEMPLRELMRGFFDRLKSASSGYASFSYEVSEGRERWERADVTRLDTLINEEEISALAKIAPEHRLNREAEEIVEKLKEFLPRALYQIKIQTRAHGRILASRTISALKKDVTGYLYGGDRTRKMKLWQKQKKGKERLKEKSRYQIPADVFLKVMK